MQSHEPTALNETDFKNGRTQTIGTYTEGTLMWKDSVAYIKNGEGVWFKTLRTGQWTVLGGHVLFLRGGEIRQKAENNIQN